MSTPIGTPAQSNETMENDINKAWHNFKNEVYKLLRTPQIVEWINNKLK